MLFKETLDRLRPEVEAAVNELFDTIQRNQVHPQDLLLTKIGRYDGPGFDGYKPFGPGEGGWEREAEHTQYEFYDLYRRQYESAPRADFYARIAADEQLLKSVRLSMQLELMIYLRFWETDRLLTKLYHYTQLALGKSYNWQYELPTGSDRHTWRIIIEQIRNPLETVCPKYFALLQKMYRSQIRNAVAHSQYYITGHNIGFNNYEAGTYADLTQKPFDWWEEIFHLVILFYNELIRQDQEMNERAKQQDKLSNGAGIQVKYTDPGLGKEDLVYWKYNYERDIWDWAPRRTQSGLFI